MSQPTYVFPASHQQQRLWFLDQLVPDSPFYNVASSARLCGPLDAKALARALERVVARHETLRTTFALEGERVVQQIAPERPLALVELALGALGAAERELELQRIALREARRPFDLAQGPLLRATLLELAADDHVLLLTLHHIAADAWSLGVLLRDLAACYRAERAGQEPELPALEIQYADYAAWQRETLRGDALERQLAHGRERLRGLVPLELPSDRPRPALPTFQGGVESFAIEPVLARELDTLCRSEGATPFMLFAAAFALLLGRHAGQDEVALGTPVAHRQRPELEPLIGFFVNTLVLRCGLDLGQSFRALLRRFRRECLDAYAHQDVPFELLVEALEPTRDLARNPLFQAMVVLLNVPVPGAAATPGPEELRFEPLRIDSGTAKFDLQLFLTPRGEAWDCALEFASDLFERATARALVERYLELLTSLAARPDAPLGELRWVAPAELAAAEQRWNDTRRDYGPELSLTERVERALAEHPEREAVRCEGAALSARELEQRANQLAHRLVRLGVRADAPVGVCLERSLEVAVALLAILKAGAAYLPLEPDLPDARLRDMASDAGVACAVTRSEWSHRLATPGRELVCLDALADELALEPDTPPQRRDHPDQLAYVIYTSGSTGRPKGVGVPHRGIANRLLWMQEAYGLCGDDRVLQKTPLGFDVSVWELFWPLLTGARLVFARPGGHRDPAYLAECIRREGITTLHFVPSMLRAFLASEEVSSEEARALPSLRRVIASGEALPGDLAARCLEQLGCELHNLYGPTEVSVDATAWAYRAEHGAAAPPIGHPIANVQAHVRDAAGAVLPVGVAGELHLGGVGLARGYLGRPALTAERFVPDPFARTPGARLYRTGDRVRRSSDGALHFLGRGDHQVKLRGHRIELGEIEAALRAQPGVVDAAVVRRDDPERLVAYLRGAPPEGAAAELVAEHVADWAHLYDELYAGAGDAPADFDTRGWTRSDTGEAYGAEAMREWVVESLVAVRRRAPRRVLEIGCGNGLLLEQLAGECKHYRGLDASRAAIERLVPRFPRAELVCAAAHEAWPAGEPVDACLLNSVAQYFPDLDYLLAVLERAVDATADGGVVVVGDLRALAWLEPFHAELALAQAAPHTRVRELASDVAARLARETELAVDPHALAAHLARHPRVVQVDVCAKRGAHATEMNRFRCDVVVHLAGGEPAARSIVCADWSPELDVDEWLDAGPRSGFGLAGIPNTRLAEPLALVRELERGEGHAGELPARAAAHGVTAPEPAELVARARARGLDTDLRLLANCPGHYTAVFRAPELAQRRVWLEPAPDTLPTPAANAPLRERMRRAWLPGLRSALAARLPEAWLPAQIVPLTHWPLTPSGKLDRRALPPPPAPASRPEGTPPRTAHEQILGQLWCEILGVERVAAQDGFFELGGDSILSIQLVQRARQRGLELRARDVFEHPTLAALAAVATPLRRVQAPAQAYAGPLEWTPIARAWQALALPAPHHWNQALLLEVPRELDPDALDAALGALVEQHDTLRLRLRDGVLAIEPAGASPVRTQRIEIASTSAIEQACAEVQSTLDLARGPVFRALRLTTLASGSLRAPRRLLSGAELERDRLLLVAHHLAVDAVSWSILVEDLASACVKALAGQPLHLPPRTTPFAEWAQRLGALARDPALEAERAYWSARTPLAPLPLDHCTGEASERTSDEVRIALPAEATRALLQEVPPVFRTRVEEVLLAAFARALATWSGQSELDIELEGHGREPLFDDVDVSRTAGWFTVQYPVRVATSADRAADVCAVKEALRAVPRGGIGYGLLRWLAAPPLASPAPEVGFNYFGRLDLRTLEGLPVRGARERLMALRDPGGARPYLIDLNAAVTRDGLELRFGFSLARHRRTTIEALAAGMLQELEEILALCRVPGAGWLTPSDFPLARLDAAELARIRAGRPRIEDIHPLTPLQEGLWLHSRFDAQPGLYVVQLEFQLRGPLDVDAFRAAWQAVVARHAALRSCVSSELERPLQIVHADVELALAQLDWSDAPEGEQAAQLEAWLEQDRSRGFDLERGPLQRLALLRLGPQRHAFVWTHHHLVLDGWSIPVVLNEVLQVYEAGRRGDQVTLPPAAPFRDYAAWLERRDPAASRAFWREALAGFELPTPLPVDLPAAEGPGVARQRIELRGAALAALERFARAHQLTQNTLVEGAFALLLARHAGVRDVVFGVASAGRPAELPHPEQRVGMFVHTLPLRVRIAEEQPAALWLSELQRRSAAAREHPPLSLVELRRASDVPAGAPLFEALLAFESYPVATADARGPAELEVTAFRYRDRTHYPLVLVAMPGADALRLELVHDTARIGSPAAARLLERLVRALRGLASSAPLGRLELLGSGEGVGAPARARHAGAEAMQHAVEQNAVLRPDAPALRAPDVELGYAELDRRANRVAWLLRSRGARAEARVGVLLPRTSELPIAILGVLKSGAAYVPLDLDAPPARLAWILRDAHVEHVLTHDALSGRLPDDVAPLCLDALDAELAAQPDGAPPLAHHPDQLAYVIYTSGSTGEPKGVAVAHRQVARLLEATRSRFDFGPADRWSVFHSAAFDFSVWELAGAWHTGGCAVLVPDDVRRSPARFLELLETESVSVLSQTPSAFYALAAEQRERVRDLGRLRWVVFGGENLDASRLREFAREQPAVRLVNMYGITETTVHVTWHALDSAQLGPPPTAIGEPLDDLALHVLDAGLRPLPPECVGELWVGGAGLARGYLGRPALTAERFVPDPFAREPGARLYRSGDLARRRSDGAFEYRGRADHQIQLRGHRIELGEIEVRLRAQPGVREVCALLDPGPPERLVAGVAGAPGLDGAELRARLAEALPGALVPAEVRVLPHWPVTPNGKLDRRALLAELGAQPAQAYVEPATDSERYLARLWAELLGAAQVGAHDDFFQLGGHSLIAAQLLKRIGLEQGVELDLRALFASTRLADLAAELDRRRGSTGDDALDRIEALLDAQEADRG